MFLRHVKNFSNLVPLLPLGILLTLSGMAPAVLRGALAQRWHGTRSICIKSLGGLLRPVINGTTLTSLWAKPHPPENGKNNAI
jgi:hypothetical protein